MLEGVSVPSLICMFLVFLADSLQILDNLFRRFCDMCGASGARNECKKWCQESSKIIQNWAWKGPTIIKNETSGHFGGSWKQVCFRNGPRGSTI